MSRKSPEQTVMSTTQETTQETAPKSFTRNSADGLLLDKEYEKDATDGSINWRGMIKKEFLVPNKERFPEGTDVTTLDVSTLEDAQLLILLGGIKDLALIRGFTSVDYCVITARQDYVAVKCTINWIPNFETGMAPVSFAALADAHFENTSGFGSNFLMAIAENRAFVRAVRNFLRINIAGQDEVNPKKKKKDDDQAPEESRPTNPVVALNRAMAEAGISFEKIQQKLIGEGVADALQWTSTDDIPKKKIFEIIERIKRKSTKA